MRYLWLMSDPLELAACTPMPVRLDGFNPATLLPFGLTTEHLHAAMSDFISFLGFINSQLHSRDTERLETILMPANFSSIVGEYMNSRIPKYCPTLVKNRYHNGHPDLLPASRFTGDKVQHGDAGIEVKGSRYLRGWQGHNAENSWLMVFCFDSNRPVDEDEGIGPKPFRFVLVAGAQLAVEDWSAAGRSATSRRTPTASVRPSGRAKMMANWIYREPDITSGEIKNLLEPSPGEDEGQQAAG